MATFFLHFVSGLFGDGAVFVWVFLAVWRTLFFVFVFEGASGFYGGV